jgi:hypothetical protein
MKTVIALAALIAATAPTYAADAVGQATPPWRAASPSTASYAQINENLRAAWTMCKPVIFSAHPENIFACMRDAGFVLDN